MALKRGSLLSKVEASILKRDDEVRKIAPFKVGDTIDIHQWVLEGCDKQGNEKRRIQVYSGTVIAMKGGGHREEFTVRRLVDGQGVERTFPTHSPKIAKIVVKRPGIVRRAKLFYLRDRVGKATRIRERTRSIHPLLKVDLAEPTGKSAIPSRKLKEAMEEIASSRNKVTHH